MSEIQAQAPVIHQKDQIIEKYEEMKFVEVTTDPSLNEIHLHRLHPYVKYVASKLLPLHLIQNLAKRLSFNHPNIFFYIKKANMNINPQKQKFQALFFEYNFPSLNQFLQKRIKNNYSFPEIELWALIKEITQAMKFLMENGIHHGDLTKHNIYFDDEYLLYRIYDNQLINSDKYYLYIQKNQNFVFDNGILPPECTDLSKYQNKYKLDIWNFGITILECATLINIQEFVYFNGKVKIDSLNEIFGLLTNKYSANFISLLRSLLDVEPINRPDWNQIQIILKNEPLSQQCPPYQVEPTQLHPNIDLNNLHEIVVGANQQQENCMNVPKIQQDFNEKSELQKDNFACFKEKNVIEGMKAVDGKKSTQENQKVGNSSVNQRLMVLNQKIQETLMQSQQKTKKLALNQIQ